MNHSGDIPDLGPVDRDRPAPSLHLTDDEVEEFRTIYREEFDEELSLDAARLMAQRLLRLYAILSAPLPSERASALDSLGRSTNLNGEDPQAASPPSPASANSPQDRVGTLSP